MLGLVNSARAAAEHAGLLDRTPDEAIPDESGLPADLALVVEEVKVTCLAGLLLCLDRDHRIAFVLTELFEAPDTVCAELLGISRDNVRQRVSRARKQLRSFLQGRCGLVDPEGTCRCARKTRSFIKQGFVDPERLQFTEARLEAAADRASERAHRLEELAEDTYVRLLRNQPKGAAPDFVAALRDCLQGRELRRTLELDN